MVPADTCDPSGHSCVGPPQRRRRASRYAASMDQTAPPSVLILGRDACDDTTRSRAFLDGRGVPFTYLRVDEDPAADAWIRGLNGGEWVTPTILIGDPDRPDRILREPSDDELAAAVGL